VNVKFDGRDFEIRGAVEQAWRCHDEEILVDGPRGTGKTTGLLLKLLYLMWKHPKCRILILRKTRAAMTESVLVTLESNILGLGHPMIGNVSRANRASYTYCNGSVLVVGGLDKVDRTKSTDYDLIVIFEATECTEDDLETLTGSLRSTKVGFQQIVLDCNPKGDRHWIIQRAKKGKMTRFPSRHEDNPLLFDRKGNATEFGKSYLARLDRLSGHRRLRDRLGLWASAEGLVYEFDAATHIVPRFDPPRDWTYYCSIDFGYTNPLVCQLWAVDHDGRMYLVHEVYYTKRTVQRHVPDLIEMCKPYRIIDWVADHDAEDRATLADNGIYTTRAKKDIRPGIDAVIERLKKAGDGRPRIFFMEGALAERDPDLDEEKKPTCTTDEFDSYSWPVAKDGRPEKEVPVDVDNHGMDATRYAVMHINEMTRYRK
jgi:phage terminase large subunit